MLSIKSGSASTRLDRTVIKYISTASYGKTTNDGRGDLLHIALDQQLLPEALGRRSDVRVGELICEETHQRIGSGSSCVILSMARLCACSSGVKAETSM